MGSRNSRPSIGNEYSGYPVPQVINVRTGGNWRNKVLATGVAGGLLLAANARFDWFDLPEIPSLNDLLKSEPEEATAGVDQESFEVEIDLDIHCSQRVSVAVDVEGFKNGPIGDGVFEKKVFGDFLLCSDNREIDVEGGGRRDPVTGNISDVVVNLSGVYVEQPRVDHLDVRNCIDGNPGDSIDEINQKLAERQQDISSGGEPDCDNGFRVTQIAGVSDLSDAIDIGFKAAQLAIAMDSNAAQQFQNADEQLRNMVLEQLNGRSDLQGANIQVNIVRPDDTQSVQENLNRVVADLQSLFTKVEFGTDDEGTYLYVEDSSGAHATVRFTGYTEINVDELTVGPVTIQEDN